ncbi:MAG: hypothetical protein IKN54_02560, partial [Lachnospiraceae bacterium]|nr:hypothetical protein [Lachnospiraceae bacterium]
CKVVVRLLKPADDILLVPDCILIPKITSVYPPQDNTSYPQDTSIRISFNKPVRLEDFVDQNGRIKNISITSGLQDLLDNQNGKKPYFKTPYLENEDKILVIPFDSRNYLINANDEQTKVIMVTLLLAGLKDAVEGENASFVQNEYTFTYKIDGSKDSDSPQIIQPFVFAQTKEKALSQSDSDHFLKQSYYDYADVTKCTLSQGITDAVEQAKRNVERNLTGESIWVYGKVRDEDSGISKIIVEEKLVRQVVYTSNNPSVYDYENPVSITNSIVMNPQICTVTGKDNTICFEYKFSTREEGTVRLIFTVLDDAGNRTECGSLDLTLTRIPSHSIAVSIKKETENSVLKTQDIKIYCVYGPVKRKDNSVVNDYRSEAILINSSEGFKISYKFKDMLFSTDGITYVPGIGSIAGTYYRGDSGISGNYYNAGYASFIRTDYTKALYIKTIFENSIGAEYIKEIVLPGSSAEIVSVTVKDNNFVKIVTDKAPVEQFEVYYKKTGTEEYTKFTDPMNSSEKLFTKTLEDGIYDFYIRETINLPKYFDTFSVSDFTPDGSEQSIHTY